LASFGNRIVFGRRLGSGRSFAAYVAALLLACLAPQALAGSTTLAWDAVANPAVAGYIIHYGPSVGNYPSRIDVGNTTSRSVSNLTEGATYHFVVTAYDASRAESGYSNDVSATIVSAAPVANFAASTTSGVAPLALNFSNTSTGNITGYRWTFGDGATSTAANPSHVYSVAGTYTVSLTVSGPAGTNTRTLANYIRVTTTADATPPTAPGSLAASTGAAGAVKLAWTASIDNVGVTGYRIERCQGAGCTAFVQIGTATALAFLDSGLAAGTTYTYRVRASDASGHVSAYSNVASAAAGSSSGVTWINVALAANGGVATASSTYSAGYSAAGAIDGRRSGVGWGTSGGWNDASHAAFPDWLQVRFNGTKTIDHVVVYTLQDNYQYPVEPTDATTFTRYGLTSFDVQAWNGTAWVTLASVRGNNLVKRSVSFPAYATDRIRISSLGSADGIYSRITEVEAFSATTAASIDVALASSGATATASSTYSAGYSPAGTIDGRRSGTGWGTSGGWHDASSVAFPDWLQINFNGTRTIDHVVVYSLQDNYQNPLEPTNTMTFSRYGLTSFDVQAWNGSGWVTLASVRGNNLVKRSVSFPAYATSHIRILILASADGVWSRITEVEAWSAPTIDVALASNGATATASSTYSSAYNAAGTIDGHRAGAGWGVSGGWHDGTSRAFPDWLQVNLNARRTIDHVTVYSVQDNYQNPVEPTNTMTFSLYGLTGFAVQAWNGSTWVTLGSVAGNNLVKRTVSFAPYTTDHVRVLVTGTADGVWSRITEIEAWGR
jgi:PKD repeat protein